MGAAEDDFAARLSALGGNLVRYWDFDDSAELGTYGRNQDVGYFNNSAVEPSLPSAPQTLPVIDTDVHCSGTGSLRFDILEGQPAGGSGQWYGNFSADKSVLFSEGEDFYIQWRQRFSTGLSAAQFAGADGWKQVIINAGDFDSHYPTSNDGCGAEVVMLNKYHRGPVHGYTGTTGYTGAWNWDVETGGVHYWQNGIASPYCLYHSPWSLDPSCVVYHDNEWMTFQVHIKVGHWGVADGVLQVWVARQGESSILVHDFQSALFVNEEPTDHHYGKIWLLPYNTGLSEAEDRDNYYTWYDELIVATAKINDPATGGGSSLALFLR